MAVAKPQRGDQNWDVSLNAKLDDLDLTVPGSANALAASGTYAPIAQVVPGVKLYNPLGLRRWSAALADALSAPASITVCGDSITVGVGSDNNPTVAGSDATYRTAGWVGQLRSLFAATYGAVGEGAVSSIDNGVRFAVAGGSAFTASIGPLETGLTLPNGGTITFTTGTAATTIEFWTWDGGGGTGHAITVDGSSTGFTVDGSGNTFSGGGGSGSGTTFTKHTIAGMSNATHTIVFTGGTGGTAYIPVTSLLTNAVNGVRVHRIAKSGNTTANLVGQDASLNGNAAGRARVLAAYGKIPGTDLLVLPFGVNDFVNQNSTATSGAQPGTTPTTYASYLLSVAQSAIANGACVLLLGEPRVPVSGRPSPMTYSEQDYYDAAKALATGNDHIAFIDLGDMLGTNAQATANGTSLGTSVHPVRKGHGEIARVLHRALALPFGQNAPALV